MKRINDLNEFETERSLVADESSWSIYRDFHIRSVPGGIGIAEMSRRRNSDCVSGQFIIVIPFPIMQAARF